MFIFRHGGRRAARSKPLPIICSPRRHASRIDIPLKPPPFPVLESCPVPTCPCRETPQGLDIDRKTNLNGLMPAYAAQVLVCTGKPDWSSKIEEDDDARLCRQLKAMLGKGGKYSDPFHNVLINHSSFAPTPSPIAHTLSPDQPSSMSTPRSFPVSKPGDGLRKGSAENDNQTVASAFILPSFEYVPSIPTDSNGVDAFVQAFLLPQQIHQSHERLTRAQQNALRRQPERQREFIGARRLDEILVLICGHGGRDERCGVLGPILHDEFTEKLQRAGVALLTDPPVAEAVDSDPAVHGYVPTARVGLISHIGGHKFAGNVIIYVPPSFAGNPLAGKGVWYGRVGPEHVEGIVTKTILDGKIIKDMFRGGIDSSGEILRL